MCCCVGVLLCRFSWYKESGKETILNWWGLLLQSSCDENCDVQFDVMVDSYVWVFTALVFKMPNLCVCPSFFLQVWTRKEKTALFFFFAIHRNFFKLVHLIFCTTWKKTELIVYSHISVYAQFLCDASLNRLIPSSVWLETFCWSLQRFLEELSSMFVLWGDSLQLSNGHQDQERQVLLWLGLCEWSAR